MSWGDANIYYNPEAFGLTQVAQIDYSDGCYHFDYRVIWRHNETGDLYTGRDSGCSCPSPFEGNKLSDLEILSLERIREEVKTETTRDYGYSGDEPTAFLAALKELGGSK